MKRTINNFERQGFNVLVEHEKDGNVSVIKLINIKDFPKEVAKYLMELTGLDDEVQAKEYKTLGGGVMYDRETKSVIDVAIV